MDETFFESMMANMASVPLGDIASEDAATFDRLREFDPIECAATFGGLLLLPELQSNGIRLEVLVHLAVAMGGGERKPSEMLVKRLFAKAGEGFCGRMEDPAEDVFVSSISTPRGNFRVLEGTWESAGFFLQRFVNVVERFPKREDYDDIRERVYSLLRLSDLICERAHLVRYQLGNDVREKTLPKKIAAKLRSIRRLVYFSGDELAAVGVSAEFLSEFIFNPKDRTGLLDQFFGHSTLERYPVLLSGDDFNLVLPTAVSAAIRRFILERIDDFSLREAFLGFLALEYGETFSRVPLLGGSIGAPIKFQRTKKNMIAGVMHEVEPGRFLQFAFFLDTLEGFEDGGLAGLDPDAGGLEDDIKSWIEFANEQARKTQNFRDGITVLIGCGVGRGISYTLDFQDHPNWRLKSLSAADLYTLSWVPDFKPLSLWRLAEAEEKVASLGVMLQNINGLLNLVAWERQLEGHLIPHGQLPDDFVGDFQNLFIMIDQNALRDLRHEVGSTWDPHVVQNIHGRWTRVRKEDQPRFEEDRAVPFYVCEEKPDGRWIPAVYVTSKRPWWCAVEVSEETSGHYSYQRWKMMTTWLSRAAPVLEEAFSDLPSGPLLWCGQFQGVIGNLPDDMAKMNFAEARALLSVSADRDSRTITLTAAPRFEEAHFNEDNIAERALVEAFVEGVAILSGRALEEEKRVELVAAIVPDSRARQTHMFRMHGFLDHVQASVPRKAIAINRSDAGMLKFALGWQIRDRSQGPRIEDKSSCLQYLSDLVKVIEADLCTDLRAFDRQEMIQRCLVNHEAAAIERNRWERTSSAVLSLHRDKDAALAVIADHDFQLNGVFQATRLLVEIAICECPLTGGRAPSELDLSRLMARMMMVQQFGGWSDAMRWDVMEPLLRITPLGDVHAKLGFMDDVVAPFARAASDVRVSEAVERYPKNVERVPAAKPVDSVLEATFLEAWKEETGAELDEFRIFMDIVDDLGIRERKAVFSLAKSRLLSASINGQELSQNAMCAIVDFLTFKSRPQWKELPVGFVDSDRQPWRFRRRLSVLRKPLLQIDEADDPTILVAPSLLREAVIYTLGNYHRGAFPPRQLKPSMRVWVGTERDRAGHQFSQEVGTRLKELGWQTDTEVKITKLLRQGFDRDYGDVDVLAWNAVSGRVLVIECKDVQYRKILGEIAEQLADFRGENGPNGKPDLLRRHLDRIDLVSEHLPAVAKFIEWDNVRSVESHLVFKNPVPMEFVLKHMAQRVTVGIFDRLDKI